MQRYAGYFVSPHPDDIAFSCYAALRNPLTRHSKSVVVTVFDNSRFSFDDSLKDAQRITQIRKEEDKLFTEANNCDLVSLDLPDSSLRYQQEKAEYAVDPDDDGICHVVERKLRHVLGEAMQYSIPIYVPLGNSQHVDHIIVRNAVQRIVAKISTPDCRLPGIFYYEDLPYAGKWSESRLFRYARETLGANCAHLSIDLNRIWIDKINSCKTYMSQIEDETIPTINSHALRVSGASGRAERLWYQPTADGIHPDFAVDTVCWAAWEACRLIGGCGVALSCIIGSLEYRRAVRRTVLIGPMYMPRDCVEYNPEEDAIEIASKLKSDILYHSLGRGCGYGLSSEIYNTLREIEFRHGVEVVYMRDTPVDEHVVERLLINLSANILPKRVYSPSLRTFIDELRNKFDLELRMDLIRTRLAHETNQLSLESQLGKHPLDNPDYNSRIKKAINADYGEYGHIDNDYIYGIVLAQPASESMRAILSGPEETCLLIVQEYLSLPTAYATILAKPLNTIKTMYYAGEVRTICSIVEGVTEPAPAMLGATGGTMSWDGPTRTLIKYVNKNNRSREETRGPLGGMKEAFLDFEPLQPLRTHSDLKILQHGWKLDKVVPVSANILDDLCFLDRGFNFTRDPSKFDKQIFWHGVIPIRNSMQLRIQKRLRLLAYTKRCWNASVEPQDQESWIILTRIARPVAAKAMYRDIAVVEALANLVPQRKLLFVVITNWQGDHGTTVIKHLLSETERVNKTCANAIVRIINGFDWPKTPEPDDPQTHLTREDIHRAADVNLCLSMYDSYNLAALEGLSCGSLSVISASCGAARRVQSLDAEINKNILVIDYSAEVAQRVEQRVADGIGHGEIVRSLFIVDDRYGIEARVAQLAAQGILTLLPRSAKERQGRMEQGWKLAGLMSWDSEVRQGLIPVLKELFPAEIH